MRLRPECVPLRLRSLIPFAERFGISDDGYRQEVVLATSEKELAELKRAVAEHDDLLDEWLAGSEADGPTFSAEYLAFTAMRMVADFA